MKKDMNGPAPWEDDEQSADGRLDMTGRGKRSGNRMRENKIGNDENEVDEGMEEIGASALREIAKKGKVGSDKAGRDKRAESAGGDGQDDEIGRKRTNNDGARRKGDSAVGDDKTGKKKDIEVRNNAGLKSDPEAKNSAGSKSDPEAKSKGGLKADPEGRNNTSSKADPEARNSGRKNDSVRGNKLKEDEPDEDLEDETEEEIHEAAKGARKAASRSRSSDEEGPKGKRPRWAPRFSYRWIMNNIGFFLFLAMLAVIYIYNGHYADKVVRDINRTNRELKELQYEYKTLRSEVMFRSKQSELAKAVEPFGLKELTQPPMVLADSTKPKK